MCGIASSTVDHGFNPMSDQIKNYQIGNACLSARHAVLTIKSKTGLFEVRITCMGRGT